MPSVSYTPSIAVDAVIDALAAFIQPFAAGLDIVRAQSNRVSPPSGPFVKLQEVLFQPLATSTLSYGDDDSNPGLQVMTITGESQIDIQVDFYGDSSGDQCKAVMTVFRTVYACDQFGTDISPLYCSDGHQGPLVDGEEEYVSRWTLTTSLQYNPTVTIPQQSAIALKLNIVEDIQ